MSDATQDINVTITETETIEVTIVSDSLNIEATVTSPQNINVTITDDAQPIEVTVPATDTIDVVLEEAFYIEMPDPIYTTRMDENISTVTYIGKAVANSSESSAVWKIERLDYSDSIMRIMFADGDSDFDNIWDERVNLDYA